MRVIILAGGYARRLWPLTLERPKPLLPVAGRPIIEHLLDKLEGRPIISINRQFAPQFERWATNYHKDVELVIEETRSEEEKLGAVGALAFLIRELGLREEILVLGGDNIFELDFKEFISAYRGRPLLALHDLGDPEKARKRYGIAELAGSRIVSFQEKPDRPHSALVSTACYIYPPSGLPPDRAIPHPSPEREGCPWLSQCMAPRGGDRARGLRLPREVVRHRRPRLLYRGEHRPLGRGPLAGPRRGDPRFYRPEVCSLRQCPD
jgi:NDP-sugar pyrophosphorylase family protein